MQPLKAHVHNGRLVLDEPTDLPDGEVIELVPLDEVLASGGDRLDDLRLTSSALFQANRIKNWWHRLRSPVPGLFERELDVASARVPAPSGYRGTR